MNVLRWILFIITSLLAAIFWIMTLEAHLFEATAPALIAIFFSIMAYNMLDAFWPGILRALVKQK
jgi:hypothetical protein